MEIGRLVAIIDGDLSGLQRALGSAQKEIRSAGNTMVDAGKALSLGVTTPLLALGGIAVKSSIDFESAFAGVRKTVDATAEQLNVLKQGIRDMSKEVPASAIEIAKVAEAAGQLGIQTDKILEFSRVMIDLGETTNLTADEAASAFAKIANVMQLPQDQFSNMGAALVDLGNKGASTERDIIEMAERIAGAGKTVGMSTADVMGLAAALSNVGIEAEMGGSAISRVITDIAKSVDMGDKKLVEFAKIAGQSAAEFSAAFEADPAMAIASFIEGLGRLDEAGISTFGTLKELKLNGIRVQDALLRTANAGDVFRTQIEIANEAWGENSALTDEAAKRYETTAAKAEILKNRLTDIAVTLGDALVPALASAVTAGEPFLKMFESLAKGFAELPQGAQSAIVGIAGLAAALGPVLLTVGMVAKGLSSLIGIIGLSKMALIGLKAASMLLLSPWGLIILAIAALVVGLYLLVTHWDEVKEAVSKAAKVVEKEAIGAFNKVLDFIKQNWPEIATLLSGPFMPIVALATDAFGIRSALVGAFNSVVSFVSEKVSAIASAVATGFTGAVSSVAGFATGLYDTVSGAFNSAVSAATGGVNSIISAIAANFTAENIGRAVAWFLLWPVALFKEAFEAVVPVLTTFFGSTLPNFFTQSVPALAGKALEIGKSIVEGIKNGLESAWESAKTFFSETLPAFLKAVGIDFVASMKQVGGDMINALGDAISSAWESTKTFFTETLPNVLSDAASDAVTWGKKIGNDLITAIRQGITDLWDKITSFPGDAKTAIVDGFNAWKGAFEGIGRAIVEGVWAGIQGLRGFLVEQVKGFFKGIYEEGKKILGIGSPSKLFAEMGKNVVIGFANGLAGLEDMNLGALMSKAVGSLSAPLESGPAMAAAGAGAGFSGGANAPLPPVINIQIDTVNATDRQHAESAVNDMAWLLDAVRTRG